LILVDTSAWIDYFNGHSSSEAERLTQAIADNEPLVMPGIVLTEILLGLKTGAEATRIAELLGAFESAPESGRRDYLEAAHIYRACRSKGFTIRSTIDCLIAQICLRNGYRLLSKDRDFRTIAQHFPLSLI
jgi:predicted nucleic acid-binding protein